MPVDPQIQALLDKSTGMHRDAYLDGSEKRPSLP
jgi:hypothetical protein